MMQNPGDVKQEIGSSLQNQVGEWLRHARGTKSQAEFAKFLGVATNSLGSYERGESIPNVGFLVRLCEITGADPADVLGIARGRGTGDVIATGRQFAISAGNIQFDPSKYDAVPFHDVAVSAGGGAEVLDETPSAWNLYRKDYLARRGLVANSLAEFTVRGDSMLPDFGPRDSVLVDLRVKQIGPEDIYVVRVDGALYIKYVRAEKDRWILRSLNAAYLDVEIRFSDYNWSELKVIGRVVRISRDR